MGRFGKHVADKDKIAVFGRLLPQKERLYPGAEIADEGLFGEGAEYSQSQVGMPAGILKDRAHQIRTGAKMKRRFFFSKVLQVHAASNIEGSAGRVLDEVGRRCYPQQDK